MTADPGPSVKVGTEYVVLVQTTILRDDEGAPTRSSHPCWVHEGTFTARSAEHAIRQYAEKKAGNEALTLVAIPARSWTPMRVAVKTETRLEVSAA